jgi:hypothetical protein
VGSGVRAPIVRSLLGAAAFSLTFLLSAVAPGLAQSPPPLPGFVPPYEITKIVRTAGFDPLAPPLREGTTYVIRATDFRGILMRVVVDAHSGAIRAVNRIVSDQGMYGAVGMLPPPYGAPPPHSGPAAAYAPPEFDVPDIAPGEEASVPVAPASTAVHSVPHPLVFEPPLPRPRPAALAARRISDDVKPAAKPSGTPVLTTAPSLNRPSPIELPD